MYAVEKIWLPHKMSITASLKKKLSQVYNTGLFLTKFKKLVFWIKALFIMQVKFSPEIHSALFVVVGVTLSYVSKKQCC